MAENKYYSTFIKGIFKENPTFVLLLGLCPTLGVTSSAINGFAMGAATLAVLFVSNILISLIRNIIPDKIRIPAYIMVIASLVTVVDMTMHAYAYDLYKVLGLFIPLIVVNCIILGRAEAFASKNGILLSALDGLGIGLGFTLSLTVLGAIREILGNGSIFNIHLFGAHFQPAIIFILPPGAFITIGFLMAGINIIKNRKTK
ncbi:electron transport complex subunit RsxE [Haliovirga abyssi]|uniref:Ion-translocating oxidoreductase complex subunit E n=1 Tax=Haliovirga abyssi TaxID=2996794 RepID=A0AAU9D565_9FUSO|nr:electron transport complex subunit E [Haliovirga abyssi]BDU49698.1 electron transport complex subunit E [Haliovirga abyssi]